MDKTNNKIRKPISMLKEELIKNIIQEINNSELPIFIIEYILKDVCNEIHIAAQQQAEQERQEYEAQLENQK